MTSKLLLLGTLSQMRARKWTCYLITILSKHLAITAIVQ